MTGNLFGPLTRFDLWNGDCLELMSRIPDGSVDLVVTSPPYDNLRTYNDSLEWSFDVFKPIARELTRCIANGGVIVWNVADATIKGSETGSSFRQALYFKDECRLNLYDTMIWNKSNPMPGGNLKSYQDSFEYMFVFSKGKPKTTNILTEPTETYGAVNTRVGSSGKNGWVAKHGVRGIKKEKRIQNVWRIPKSSNGNGHPAVFPIQLPIDHILSWSNPGDKILDPFMGSGTTGLAARLTGRSFIGIEKDDTYFEMSRVKIIDED